MMEGVTLSHQYNYQQLRKKYSNGRSNVDQIDSKSQRQQEQEDLTEDINDIELGRAFDLNALESRLSDCFGHMRNDFEGEYICEKQGPMFGNYGSFLPIREHNPQTPKQVNSSVLLHNYSSQTTASERAVEKAPRLAITDGPWRRGSIAWRNPSLNDNTLHEFTKENLALNDTKVDGILPVEKMTANGVKLRFKCSSDIIHHPKNTAIYTDLGLQNSSSTSLEESLDKGQMVTTEVDSPPDMSPLSIIQIMTSYEVPGGSLLSPLPERLMEGQGKEDLSSKVIKRTSGKLQVNEACLANSIGFECGKGIQAPLPKEDTTASIFESKKEQYSEFRGEKVKKVKTDTGTKFRLSKASDPLVSKDSSKLSIKKLHQGKPEMGIAHDVETNIHRVRTLIAKEPNNLTNEKDFSSCPKSGNLETAAAQHPGRLTKTGKGLMPGGAKESHKMEREDQQTETRKENGHKDVADVRKINKSFKEVNKLGLSGASTYKGKNVLDDENKGVPKGKVLRHVATHEKVVVNTEHVKHTDMENKKTNNVNIYQKTMKEESKVVTKYKFKESLIEKSWVSKGQKEQSKKNSKDLHGNSAKCMNEQIVCKKEISMAHCKESTKQARHKHFDREISMGIERGKRRDVANEHDSKKLEHVSTTKARASKVETQSLLEQSATQGPATGTSDVDDWVYCDACGKWRLCPIGVKISPLPKKWLCHMMFWLPSMNHCDVPEEETTKAVYNLNAISQTQVLSETSQGKGQLPASVSTAILDPKPSNQIWPKSLQSSTKIGSNKKGLVQRNMPNVSGTVKFSNSFAGKDEHFPVNKKSDRYERHMEREEGAIDFSSCDDGGKSNGVINQKNKVKDKVKLKETSAGEACETEVVHAHTLNVKRTMDTELKECKSAKKLKAKEDLACETEVVHAHTLNVKRKMDTELKECKSAKKLKAKEDLACETKVVHAHTLNVKRKMDTELKECKSAKKLKAKEGLACETKVVHAHTLNVKCKMDIELKECKSAKKLKAKENLVHDAKGVDLLPLKSERTDHGFKIITNDELTKDNGVESMNREGKIKDRQQVTKKSKLMERKEQNRGSKSTPLASCTAMERTKQGTLWPQLKSPMWNGVVERNIERALVSPNMEHQSSMANAALQEGRDLEQKADRLKNNGGDELGVIGFYFRASLKFLQSASILEPLNADSVRHQENTSLALFTYSARLSEGCAKVYEQNGMWAAATLAYQCTGVARMHVVMGKTVSISKDRQELQSAAVLVPTGESPRSSASDVDNLNCHALTVVNQEKGLASLHASGNYVIDTKHCQHYNRLLQFVDDTNAAFKAFAKANSAFAAASDSSYREQEISVVKKAINLNFHNLDGLLRLVIPAMGSTSLC